MMPLVTIRPRHLLFLLWLAAGSLHAATGSGQSYDLDMRNTDIQEFIATISKLTGKTFIVDQRVKGKINLQTPQSLSQEELYDIFLMQLGINGFSVVDMGNGLLKIIPSQAAKLEGVPVQGDGGRLDEPGESIITRIVQVRNVEVTKLVPVLRPLVDNKTGVIAPYAESNVLLITDRASNVKRLVDIVQRVDKADSQTLEIVSLQNASAPETARVLSALLREQGKAGGEGVLDVPTIVADERTNSLLIRGNATSRSYLKEVIKELDNEIRTSANTKVHYLKYAKAKDIIPVLKSVSDSIIEEQKTPGSKGAPAERTTNINIEAHEQTNAIVLSGSPQMIRNLEGILQQLDIRRAQVLVEAIIVELSETRAKELGVQWLFSGGNDGRTEPLGFVNFANSNSGIVSIGGAAASGTDDLARTLSGIQGVALGVGKITSGGFSFAGLLNALASDSDSNVLSTPSLMTMDNEEASILVGQEVPIVTGSTASSTNTNPFQTISRQDIGIKLRVTPQINEGDAVQLSLQQEVSSLSGLSASDIIINKREITTSVLVDDSATVVLGGLIDDDVQESTAKVPLLGSLPLVGHLFRSDLTRKVKRNLMVFIRPTIVRDNQTLSTLSSRKYNYIKAEQLLMGEKGINLFPEVKAPVLPEWGAFGPSPANLLDPAQVPGDAR